MRDSAGKAWRYDLQFWKFRAYGFLKNLRFFDPFLLLFLREAGLSFLAIGSLISIREIATNLLEIPSGVLADIFGRRRAMLVGFSFYLLAFLLFYLGSAYGVFVLAMLAFAVGETFRSGTHKAMILEHLRLCDCEDRKVTYYGKTRAASQLGSAIASLIAAGLVFWTGSFRIVFLASIVPTLLNLLLLASYPKSLDGVHLSGAMGWSLIHSRFAATLRSLGAMLRDSCTIRGLASSAGFDALFKASKDYLQPIVQAQALALPLFLSLRGDQRTALLVGITYFAIFLATSWASSRAGHVQSRLKHLERGINLTFLLGVGLFAVSGIAVHLRVDGVAILAFLIIYMLQNLRRPMLVGYLADRIQHGAMASGLSMEVQLRTLLLAGLAPLLGGLADRYGIGIALLLFSGGAFLFSPLVVLRAERSK